MSTSRFPPLPEEDWSTAQRDVAGAIIGGPRGQLRGPFVSLLYSPKLAGYAQKIGEYLRFETKFTDSLVELAVLVTARHWNCANIWHSHRALALKAGLNNSIISAIAERRRPAEMAAEEAAIFDFCNELHHEINVGDEPFDRVVAIWGSAGAIDLIGLCGYYVFLAMVLNTSRTALPDGAVPFEP